jgi:hypothetical protein
MNHPVYSQDNGTLLSNSTNVVFPVLPDKARFDFSGLFIYIYNGTESIPGPEGLVRHMLLSQ